MDRITGEVRHALEVGLHYLAVVVALTLPDICAALESPTGETSGVRYKAWYNTWLAPRYPMITDKDMWSLRNGVVHQGKFGHQDMQYDRVLFTVPNTRHIVIHGTVINDALNLDADRFCRDVIAAVNKWHDAEHEDPNVVSNLPRLIQYREHGLAPYISGLPLIA